MMKEGVLSVKNGMGRRKRRPYSQEGRDGARPSRRKERRVEDAAPYPSERGLKLRATQDGPSQATPLQQD